MRVYVEETGRRIQPFDDPMGETPVLHRPLADWQAEAFHQAGLRRVHQLAPPCLVIPDTALVTGDVLREFVREAAGADAVLVLARSKFGEATTPVQPDVVETPAGWRFEKLRFVSGRGQAPQDVIIDPRERTFELELPKQFTGQDVVEWAVPRRLVMTLHHWVHVLWANQAAAGYEALGQPRWKAALHVLTAVARARSLNKWNVLGRLNVIGRGCDIHPTAIVEGCTLGDGVKVGPYARLLFSNLDRGANVMPGAYVEMCVLGANAVVTEQTVLRLCVLYERAVASQYLMQQCVFGRDATTTAGAGTFDLSFDREIRVKLDGELHDTSTRYLGAAFGHRCVIGAGFWLAAGRAVPNDYLLVRDPDRTLSVIPEGLSDAGPLVANGKRLRPLK